MKLNTKIFKIAILLAVVIALPLVLKGSFIRHILFLVGIYVVVGEAWNLLGGFLGYVSFGHAAFFGLGAYTTAVLFKNFGLVPWVGMIAGGVTAVIGAAVIAYPVFKWNLRGHYFAIATLAYGLIMRILFKNFPYVGGARGIMIPLKDSSLLLMQFHESLLPYVYIAFGLAIATFFILKYVVDHKLGFYLQSVREDEDAAACLGVPVTRVKHLTFYITAFLCALAGAIYAQYNFYFNPPMVYKLQISINMVLVAILGGRGTLIGPVLGAILFVPLLEYSRAWLSGMPGLDFLIVGILLMVIIVFQPKGVFGLLTWLRGKVKRRIP